MSGSATSPPASHKPHIGSIYAISLVLAACSLLYELLIAQTLSLLSGNMVVWYSLTVGIYLGAMGLGAVLYGKKADKGGWDALYQVEILLSIVGALAVLLMTMAHFLHITDAVTDSEFFSVALFYAVCFLITFVVGILTGLELPLLIHLGNEAAGENVTNRILGWDYIGALVAGIVFPLYFVPNLELMTIGFVTAAVNLAVAMHILFTFLAGRQRITNKLVGSLVFGALLIVGFLSGEQIEQYFLKKYYYYIEARQDLATLFSPMNDFPHVFRASSPYQKIDIVKDPEHSRYNILIDAFSTKFIENRSKPVDEFLFLNGDFQVTSNFEELYHEWFAHVPIILSGKAPERVLIMGGGDGLLHRELLKYKEVKSILHIDIDRTLIHLAKTNPILTAMNEHSLEDPRVETRFSDAFQFIRNSPDKFDAIYMDFPFVVDYNLSKLYSREFYNFVRQHLTEGGFAVLDAPALYFDSHRHEDGTLHRMNLGSWDIHYSTMRLAGFKTVLAYYSILEVENPKAYEILEQSRINSRPERRTDDDFSSGEEKRKWMRAFIRKFGERLQQGFIMMTMDDIDTDADYIDFGIKLHMLNEERFKLATPVPPASDEPIELGKVNSIMRPTLPRGRIWQTRTAW